MGGYVSLSSELGRGSTFTLHLPRTIAVVHVLLVRVARETFAIPIAKILKTVEVLPHQVKKSQGQSYFFDRQEIIPMKPLHRFLDQPEPVSHGRDPIPALIVEVHKRKNALVVDELVRQEEAFVRPLGKPLERIPGLSGVTMLGDGQMVFVLDTMSLL
jgi:two-component system chemotaxis sensor kinase CheA